MYMQVECASFEQVIPEFKYDFLYCDPPYYLSFETDYIKLKEKRVME